MPPALLVIPVAVAVIAVCCVHLIVTQEREEVPTERSTTGYSCRACRRHVVRGNVLKYISDCLLCERCWLDDRGRMRPADVGPQRRRQYRAQVTSQPLFAASMMRGSALLVFLNRRKS